MTWKDFLSSKWFLLLLIFLWAVAYLPNFGNRTLRLEEGRRALPAREMLQSGNFIVPTLYGDTYLNKPPLHFWIIAATSYVLGGEVTTWTARLPSVISALLCALVAFQLGKRYLSPVGRAMSALFVLTTATLLEKGMLAEIDTVLCLFVAWCMKLFWDAEVEHEKIPMNVWVKIGIILGFSALHKGPTGPAIFYMTVVPYWLWVGKFRQLFTLSHIIAVVLSTLPTIAWVVALMKVTSFSLFQLINIASEQVGVHQTTGMIAGTNSFSDSSHYVTFLPISLVMMAPGVFWIVFALSRRWSAWLNIPENWHKFLICGFVFPLFLTYLYPESRPRHLMPMFFMTAIFAATVVDYWIRNTTRLDITDRLVTKIALGFLAIIGAAAIYLMVRYYPQATWVAILTGVCTLVFVVMMWKWNRPPSHGFLNLAATTCVFFALIWMQMNACIYPWLDTKSVKNREIATIKSEFPHIEQLWTTRSYALTGGDNLFNHCFHYSKHVRGVAVEDLTDFEGKRIVLLSEKELATIKDRGKVRILRAAPPIREGKILVVEMETVR
ncbi:MAG: glycosyltransferase family 39 protein [Zavarzinella sp.]